VLAASVGGRDIEKRHCYKTLRRVLFCPYLGYTPVTKKRASEKQACIPPVLGPWQGGLIVREKRYDIRGNQVCPGRVNYNYRVN
jgi:hypothetical protein